MRRLYLGICFLLLPQAVAAVEISEIAWMGSVDSPNHEWIELHNTTGTAVDTSGWMLHDEANLTIELSGIIQSGQYVVLERTSDLSAPGAAFLVYTGALSNTGATLVLRNAAGAVVDQVSGGVDWELVGGDNVTKDTAQRTSVGWQTAPSTPGTASNESAVATPVTTHGATSNSGSGVAVKRVVKEPAKLTLRGVSLQLAVTAPDTVYVGQPTTFSVQPSGVGDTIADSLQYEWSMGNGAQSFGKDSTYTYQYPGDYVVVVAGIYKRQKQFSRQQITVLPVQLQLTQSDGVLILSNSSDAEIDVGGYRLVGSKTHVFPKHTILLPNAQVTISLPVTESAAAVVMLYDQTDAVVASAIPSALQTATPHNYLADARYQPVASAVTRKVDPAPPLQTQNKNFGFVGMTEPEPSQDRVRAPLLTVPTDATSLAAAVGTVPDASLPQQWPLLALVVLLLLGTLGIYLVPRKDNGIPWI